MSTTNILNSTVTGVPFLEIGRISIVDKKIKINYQKKKNKQFFFICMSCNAIWCYAKVKIKGSLISYNPIQGDIKHFTCKCRVE